MAHAGARGRTLAICISVNESDKRALFGPWMLINCYYVSQCSLSEEGKKMSECRLSHLTSFTNVISSADLNASHIQTVIFFFASEMSHDRMLY